MPAAFFEEVCRFQREIGAIALNAKAFEGERRTGTTRLRRVPGRSSRSLPAESEPRIRTAASRPKPPLACQVSMPSPVCSTRWKTAPSWALPGAGGLAP